MSNVTITLKHPVKVASMGEVKLLTFRRPKVKDTRLLADAADGNAAMDANNRFLAQLSGVPPEVFDELDLEDMAAVQKVVAGFTKGIES